MTANDGSGDGKHITYLKKQDWRDRDCDLELFDALKEMVEAEQRNGLLKVTVCAYRPCSAAPRFAGNFLKRFGL